MLRHYFSISLVLVVGTLAAGCATVSVSSEKSPAFSQPAAKLKLAYFAAPLTERGSIADSPAAIRASSDSYDLGRQIITSLPKVLEAAGVSVESTYHAPTSPPASLSTLKFIFPTTADKLSRVALLISPQSSATNCPGACFSYRMKVLMIDLDNGTELWKALFDTPPKASRLHDFSSVADGFSKSLLDRMKGDQVIPVRK